LSWPFLQRIVSNNYSVVVILPPCCFNDIIRSLKIKNPYLQRVNSGFSFLNASAILEITNFKKSPYFETRSDQAVFMILLERKTA
jgi:hypothetical protein